MKIKKKHLVLLSALIVFPVLVIISISDSDKSKTLFVITRNFDENILNYDLRLNDKGELVQEDPIHPYWIRNTEGGIIKELNGMQRKFAYGLEYDLLDEDFYRFNFVSYDKMDLYLRKSNADDYHVLTKIDDRFVIVQEIFLQVEKNGTIFNLPKLNWVDIKWYAPSSGNKGVERIDPNE